MRRCWRGSNARSCEGLRTAARHHSLAPLAEAPLSRKAGEASQPAMLARNGFIAPTTPPA
ncbi:hypothetical protein CBM2637_A210054 [Cupriavidus taiwanensis]|nr:hypothetical protein CBM2637_A210054 [Cupriavidus taiwanensis]